MVIDLEPTWSRRRAFRRARAAATRRRARRAAHSCGTRRGVRARVGPHVRSRTPSGASERSAGTASTRRSSRSSGTRDEVAGVSLNYDKRMGDWGWIGTLGVRPAWRRRGLGLALLRESFRRFQERARRSPRSASTPRTRPGQPVSTIARACACSGMPTSGRRSSSVGRARLLRLSREPPSRQVPGLPHADRGRGRCRLPVPQLRSRVRGRARAGASRLGQRRRGHGSRQRRCRSPTRRRR